MEVQEGKNASDEGLGPQDATTTSRSEEDCHMQLLRERRAMETREELKRIECMEKVRLMSKKIDRRLGRNLFRKIHQGPLDRKRSFTPQTAPIQPYHVRAQSSDAQSARVVSDSAVPDSEKPRRGSSGSVPQDTTHHHHDGIRSKRRSSSDKKQDLDEPDTPTPELPDSVSPSRRGFKDTFESAKKKFSRRYSPYEPSENAAPSSQPKRNFKDSFESAKNKFSRRHRKKETSESPEEPPSPSRSFKETYDKAKSKFSRRYKQQEVSEVPEPKENFKETYDTAKSKFSRRSRQQEAKEVVEASSDTKRSFKDVYEAGKQKFTRHHRGDEYEVGHRALPGRQDSSKESVRKELDEIQKMGVVRSSTASSVMLKNHIHSHLSRMSNHRLMIKSGGMDRKKSSVLVTMDDTEEHEKEILRQQTRAVMDKFFEMPSRKQRMLERLSSMQVEESVYSHVPGRDERPVRPHGAKLKEKLNAVRKDMELDSPAIPEGESIDGGTYSLEYSLENVSPPKISKSAPPFISSTASLPPLSSPASATPPMPSSVPPVLSSMPPMLSGLPLGQDSGTSGNLFFTGRIPDQQSGAFQRIVADGGGDKDQDKPKRVPNSLEGGSDEDQKGVTINGEEGEEVGDELVAEIQGTSFIVAETEMSKTVAIVDEKWSSTVIPLEEGQEEREREEEEVELVTTITMITPEAFYSDRILTSSISSSSAPPPPPEASLSIQAAQDGEQSLGFSSVQKSLKKEESLQSQSSFSQGSPRSQRSLRSEGSLQSQESRGYPVSQDSIGSEPSPRSKRHRYSTPQLSLSMSAGDFASPSYANSHGFYSSLEIEVNPFNMEFEAGPKHGSDGSQDADLEASSGALSSEGFPDCLFSSRPSQKEIPKEAFDDPNFIKFIEGLDHKPVVQDYITYKVQVIGDRIEQKYADKLSQAMDQVFYELVKESLSWGTFKNVSTWLFLQGSRVQDGIMLVPCFARQLMEVVPHMGTVLGQYTEGFLDMHVSENNLLGVEGLSTLMTSYGEDHEEYSSAALASRQTGDYYGSSVDLTTPHPTQNQRPDWLNSPALMTPGSATTMPSKKRRERDTPSIPSFEDPGPSDTSPMFPHSYCLRRSISVEVLLEETKPPQKDPTPSPHPNIPPSSVSLSKSLSIGSGTPTTPLTFSPQFLNLRSAVFADSNMTPPPLSNGDGKVLSVVHEESRLTARRGSASSVVIISHTHTEIETIDGFDVIGRPLASPDPHPDETESVSSEFEYMRNPYSVRTPVSGTSTPRRRGSDAGTVRSLPSSQGEERRGVGGRERRRSSASEVLIPAALITVHAVALGFMLTQ